jgi:hypothetical protein
VGWGTVGYGGAAPRAQVARPGPWPSPRTAAPSGYEATSVYWQGCSASWPATSMTSEAFSWLSHDTTLSSGFKGRGGGLAARLRTCAGGAAAGARAGGGAAGAWAWA